MHIIFFADNFPPEGNAIASRVFERACYWVKWGHQVTVITSQPNFPEGKIHAGYKNKFYQVEIMAGIKVVRIKTFITRNKGFILRTLDFMSYMLPAIIAGLCQKNKDSSCVIIATTPHPFAAFAAKTVAAIRKNPFILEVADIWPASIVGVGVMQSKNRLIQLLEKFELYLYRKAAAIVVLTPAFKKNLVSRGIPSSKITVVTNGVELAKYNPLPKDRQLIKDHQLPDDAFIIGYIGTQGMAHALMNVLYTAEKYIHIPQIFFIFVGSGAEHETLLHYADSKKLTNVKFIAPQPKNKIANFWSVCDLALVHLKNDPVFSEVIPSKIFEAMGMGLPILLAAPEGDASHIITQNGVGLWVPAEDQKALAEAIHYYYQHPDERQQLAEKSRQTAALYSRERQAKEMLWVIQEKV